MYKSSLQRTGSSAAATGRRGSTIVVRSNLQRLRTEEAIASSGLLHFQTPTAAAPNRNILYPGGMAESQDSQQHHQEEASHTKEEDLYDSEDAQRETDGFYDSTHIAETQDMIQPRLESRVWQMQRRSSVERHSSSGTSTHLSSSSMTPHENVQRGTSSSMNNTRVSCSIIHTTPTVGTQQIQPPMQGTIANSGARVLANLTNIDNPSPPSSPIREWEGSQPDAVMKRLKSITKDKLESIGRREFYKSYMSWERMTVEQRNKTVSYFRSLPVELQGLCFLWFTFYFACTIY